MRKAANITGEEAQVIALKALTFLASESDRIGRFMGLTGLTPPEIRRQAAEPGLQLAVLDHLRGDQSLLLIFAEAADIDPGMIDRAAVALGGRPA